MKYKFNPFIGKLDSVSSNASEINYPQLGTSTYKTVEDCHNICASSGRADDTSFIITAHSPADGTVDVSSGRGSIKIANTVTAQMKFFDFAGVNSIALTDKVLNYLYVDYNAGTPQILVTTDRLTVHDYDQFVIGRVFREGNSVYFLSTGINAYAETRRNHDRLVDQFGFRYANGATTSESGTRKIAVTAGRWYIDNNLIINAAFDTNVSSVIESYYYNGSAWIEDHNATTIDNAQYNNVASGLTALGVNKYVNAWIYLTQDGLSLIWVYGQAQYNTLSEAQVTSSPSLIPPHVQYFAKLIARITLRQGTTNFVAVSNALVSSIPSGVATSHSNLTNLAWTSSGHTGTANKPAAFDSSGLATNTLSHTQLTDVGTNTHAQIDTALGTFVKINGTTPLTADWDAGSFEIRAQTLESDVATGTAPLTIASTTKVTNFNADLLDGLHDTGYTKTTAGQTINVATAAELTAALAALAAAPSLLGNVRILLAAGTYTGNWTIPCLLYNGFTLTIEGTLTSTASFVATGGTATVYGTSYGTVTGSSFGSWQYLWMQNPTLTSSYALIESNTSTTINHFCQNNAIWGFPTVTNGQIVNIYSQGSEITGTATLPTIILSPYSTTYFKNIKISNTSGSGAIGEAHAISGTFATVDLYNTHLYSTGFIAFMLYKSRAIVRSCIFQGGSNSTFIVRIDEGSSSYQRSACGSLYLGEKTDTCLFNASGESFGNINHGHLLRATGGTSAAINCTGNSFISLSNAFVDNVGTAIMSQTNGYVADASVKYTNIAVTESTNIFFPGFEFDTSSPELLVRFQSQTTTQTTQINKAKASQTSNLQEYQDSSGNVLAKILPAGDIELTASTRGIILTDSDSVRWRVTVGTDGALTTTSL